MANNFFRKSGAVIAPHFFLLSIALLIFAQPGASAQNISKSYVASNQPDGILYYIVPQKGFQNAEAKIEYDITYKTSQDSAIFNFSYFDKSEKHIDSLSLQTAHGSVMLFPKRIYVETRRSRWHYRYTSSVLFSELEKLYKPDTGTAKIILYSSGKPTEANIKKATWEDQSSKLSKIFTMINLNSKNPKR